MEVTSLLLGLRLTGIRRVLMVAGVAVTAITLFQCVAVPYGKRLSLSSADWGTVIGFVANAGISNNLTANGMNGFNTGGNGTDPSYLEGRDGDVTEGEDAEAEYASSSDKVKHGALTGKTSSSLGNSSVTGNVEITDDSYSRAKVVDGHHSHLQQIGKEENMEQAMDFTVEVPLNGTGILPVRLDEVATNNGENLRTGSLLPANVTPADPVIQTVGTLPGNTKPLQIVPSSNSSSTVPGIFPISRREIQPISISEMDSILLQSVVHSHSMRPRLFSACDRELVSARTMIQNAPIVANSSGLHASVFRNISMFVRSYELMERLMKVYIYKEGEKPFFHQSKMRGIYASEGWFMKLIEGNKKFVVRDARKAHLFYLPFSSLMLRTSLFEKNYRNQKYLEEYLKQYVDLIAQKHSFWNRTGGADHFLVACHDWASRVTRHYMGNCIRALCNANVGKDFVIGKDTTLPATYIRSAEDPLKDIGGKPASERYILAFFAGGIHGYVRPVLLKHWENKEPDMKIVGPMPRDTESKRIYREYMKSSKYCICVRGHEVFSPRVVEAIFHECVPVIISDNYVPPLFEVLNWEAFSVFVKEKDIPNLRNILLSIPEEKYLAMQFGVKMVQQHFLWHKKPVKYDLFHMILHSLWRNRVFQL